MNLFKNSNLTGGNNLITRGKPKNVFFSGFLIAFLGASGIQIDIPADFSVSGVEEEKAISACAQEGSTLASLEIANATTEKESEVSKECKAEKKIKKVLKEKTTIPGEASGDTQAVAEMKEQQQEKYEKRIVELEKLLKGYPLAKMAPEIAKQEPEIAALIVGIARKESQWGLRSPKKNGDCFNYWGYKGSGGRGVGMGYACFATREEAIEKIATRLEKLVDKRGTSKPNALVTPWKCGNSCATHSPESVRKWVSDVNQYYTKVLAM